jgi:hypothetical protein
MVRYAYIEDLTVALTTLQLFVTASIYSQCHLFVSRPFRWQPLQRVLIRAPNCPANAPKTAIGASIPHSNSFDPFSFEPAFWVEFFGHASNPNNLTFNILEQIHEHGGNTLIRPGGITMDSMVFDPNGGDVVRSMANNSQTRIHTGKSWTSFPNGTRFVSTLNFRKRKLEIWQYIPAGQSCVSGTRQRTYKLRWNDSTSAYVSVWGKNTHLASTPL